MRLGVRLLVWLVFTASIVFHAVASFRVTHAGGDPYWFAKVPDIIWLLFVAAVWGAWTGNLLRTKGQSS